MFALTAKYASGWNVAGAGWDVAAYKTKYDGYARACREAGKNVKDMDICLLSFVSPEPDAASAKRTLEALAEHASVSDEDVSKRWAVGTPDEIAARMRPLADLGVNHFMCGISMLPDQDRYLERMELLAREVFPRVRA